MARRLSQVLGVERGVRNRARREFTALYRRVERPEVFNGFERSYHPVDDDGERLPNESRKVETRVDDCLVSVRDIFTEMYDIVATKETGNVSAKADVEIDGQVILSGVPVTLLLFLEKQLEDLYTFTSKLPVLDPAEEWDSDRGSGLWRGNAVETTKYKKQPRSIVKAEATPEHPAQVDVIFEDLPVGRWTRVAYSGAVTRARHDSLCKRVTRLRDAVISAREAANATTVDDVAIGRNVFDYLFGAD